MKCGRCGFENPTGFAFCGKCGAALTTGEDRLAPADLDHLRAYLPLPLVEALQFDLVSPSPRLLEQCLAHLAKLLDTVYTHLPPYLVERVVGDPTPGQTGGEFVMGTLLFADISGFTAMSERLSRIGREGAEEVTAIVNRYFEAMLSILHEREGQLIRFGGDALLGLFLDVHDAPDGKPDSATRAVQAALRMQAAMADFAQTRTSLGVFPLQMKVGVHKGRFFAAQLGAAQSMEYGLFGSDVNATAIIEAAGGAGQVLIDRATFDALVVPCVATLLPGSEGYFTVEHIESSPPLPYSHTPPLSLPIEPTLDTLRYVVKLLDALIPYLPAGLLGRLAGDPRAVSLEGEHRLVATLFANVRGLGDIVDRLGRGREEQIVAALNQYFVAMGNAIWRFGGVINKIDLNEHGDKLLAFFGAPLAHEDDAERAVRAALAMQEMMKSELRITNYKFALSQHIGISYGYVFAGYVGTTWRHEYTVMGDEVNLAARLMSIAEPGGVIASHNIRRKVQALFDLTPHGEVALRGKSQPIPIFSVSGVRAAPEPLRGLIGMRSPLVGRDADWNQLRSAMDQLRLERGQIVSIVGEAGLGKSRLVAELRQHVARASGVFWIEGHCLSYTESVSYFPFQDVMRQIAGIRLDDGEAEAWNKLREALAQRLPRDEVSVTLPYVANFLNLPLDGELQEKVRYLDAEALQRRTFVAIRTLIEAQTNAAPLALVLDDLHWIDQASLALLEYLMPLVDRAPLMLLLLYRPDREKGCWRIREKAAREFAHCTTEIALHSLAAADSRQLLANLTRLDNWPAEALNLIVSRTEGNPLYLEEVIRALIDDRILIRDDVGQWRLSGRVEAIQVPDTLQGVLMTRLDRLEEPCRRTAQIASVVGRDFPFDVLAHIAAENEADLNPWLTRLQQHEIVAETQRTPELIYTFRHGMMQEVCYSSLLARVRHLYHRKVAEYLEASRSEAESDIPLIAHHAFAAQDWPRALHYQALAGQQAQQLFANHEAIDHFQKALQSAENLPASETAEQRQAIHAALGELSTTTSQFEPALEHLTTAHTLAVERGDRDVQARACRWLAHLHELRGEYSPAFDWIQRGLAALAGRETAEAVELRLIAGFINTRQGNNDQALDHCQNALRIAQDLGEVTVLARAYNLLGHIIRLLGQSGMAIEDFQRAFDLYQRAGDIHGQALTHNLIANAYFDMGQWQAADQHYRRAREMFSQTGDTYYRASADNNLGGIARNQGRLDEALSFYREALDAFERISGSPYILGILHMNLGATFIRRHDIDTARRHLHASQDYFEKAQARDFLPELHRHLAQAALIAGELPEAETQCQQALRLARELTMRGEEGCSLDVLGEIYADQGRLAEAETPLTESVAILEEVADEYELARSRLVLARVYGALGKREAGLAMVERCVAAFERLEAALDLAAARTLREELERSRT